VIPALSLFIYHIIPVDQKVIRFLLTWQHLVEIVKHQAYKNVYDLKLIEETKLNYLNLAACLKARQSDTQDQGLQHVNISTAQGICNGITFGYFIISYSVSLSKTLNLQGINHYSLSKGYGRTGYAIRIFCLADILKLEGEYINSHCAILPKLFKHKGFCFFIYLK